MERNLSSVKNVGKPTDEVPSLSDTKEFMPEKSLPHGLRVRKSAGRVVLLSNQF